MELLDERFEELLEELFDERLDEEFELEFEEEFELEFDEELELELDDPLDEEFELELDELLPATMKLPSLRLVVVGAGRSMSGAMRGYSMACAAGPASAVRLASAAEAIFQCRFMSVTPLWIGSVVSTQ